MRIWRALGATLAAALIALPVAGCTPAAVLGTGRRAPCAAVFFGVAGSGQGPHFPAPSDVPRGMSRADARDYGPVVARVKDALEVVSGNRLAAARAIAYPATTAAHWASLGGLTGLVASEAIGARHVVAAIRRSYRGGCAERPVLLAGYSQGAEVVVQAVDALPARRRRSVTVALFGNPSFEPGLRGNFPARSANAGVRPTFLGRRAALLLPKAVRRRTIDVCAPGDPVCGVGHPFGGVAGEIDYLVSHMAIHSTAYGTRYADLAARFLWQHRVPMH